MKLMLPAALAVIAIAACGNDGSTKSGGKPTSIAPPVPTPPPIATPVTVTTTESPSRGPEPPVTNVRPTLTWKMSLSGSALQIDYTITNAGSSVIYIVDHLVIPARNGYARTKAITVMNDDALGVVKFALASISGDAPAATLYTPTYRTVAAGATFTGTANVPYPLKAWHPVVGPNPIAPGAKQAVLLIGYFGGEPPQWITTKSDDAAPLKVPEGHQAMILRVGPMPLPVP